jgi:hypothetical protein
MEENKVKEAWETPRVDVLSVNVNTESGTHFGGADNGSYS